MFFFFFFFLINSTANFILLCAVYAGIPKKLSHATGLLWCECGRGIMQMNLNMNAPLLYDDRSGRQIQHDVRPPTAHLRQYEVHAEFYYFSSWVNIHMKYTYYLRGIYELNIESGPMALNFNLTLPRLSNMLCD